MTDEQRARLAALLERGCWLPAARELAQRMLQADTESVSAAQFPPALAPARPSDRGRAGSFPPASGVE